MATDSVATDLYELLGVSRDAPSEDIKRAYRRLARELHPDVNPGDAEAGERFKEVSAAYAVLSDPEKRRQYDMFGTRGSASEGFGYGVDLGQIFEQFFGSSFGGFDFGGGQGAGFGGARTRSRRRSRAERGADLLVRLRLSFEEAAAGGTREVEVSGRQTCLTCQGYGAAPGTQPSACTRCNGSGEMQEMARSVFGTIFTSRPCTRCEGTGEEISTPCEDCRGAGLVEGSWTVEVDVPGGIDHGMQVRVSGEGEGGRAGGPAGDLYVEFDVEPHEVFARSGQDLVATLQLPLSQAVLGAEIQVPTLDGSETVRIDPGTPHGAVYRVRGKGLPHLRGRGRGDLLLGVEVEIPKHLSREERQIFERLAESRGERSRKRRPVEAVLRKPSG